MQDKFKIFDTLEALRTGEHGKAVFFVLIGFCTGLIAGLLLGPRYLGCFNGSWSGNGSSSGKLN